MEYSKGTLVRVSDVHNSFFHQKMIIFALLFFSKKTLYYISSSLIYYYCCNVISQEGGWYLIWMTLENHYNTISYLALVGSSTEVFDSEEPAEERFFFDKFLLVLLIKNASSDWDRVELAHPKITFKVRLFQKWCNFFYSQKNWKKSFKIWICYASDPFLWFPFVKFCYIKTSNRVLLWTQNSADLNSAVCSIFSDPKIALK